MHADSEIHEAGGAGSGVLAERSGLQRDPRPGVPAAADLNWREFFTDERLQKIIETALTNNRDLRLASLNVERARALYRIQRNELFPAVNAAGSGGKERVPADLSLTGSSYTAEQYSVSLGITAWEIDFFGRIRSLKKKALEEYFATEEARRSAQILLISEVANAYLTLAADRETLKLARSTLEAQQEAYDLIRKRYEKGLATGAGSPPGPDAGGCGPGGHCPVYATDGAG